TPLLIPQEQLLAVFFQPDPARWPPTGVPPNCGLTDEQIQRLPAPLQRDALRQPCGNAQYGMILVFLLAVVAIWLGTSNAVKEIVKELPIYRRERMVSLKIVPYLLSKMTVLFALAALQTALLLGIVMAFVAFPIQSPLTVVGMFFVTFLTFVAAIMLGLFVSSLVGSNDEAGNLAPVLLIPQFIFAGAVFPLNEMGVFARYIAQAMFSKWSWEALNAIVDIQRVARAQGGPSLDLLDTARWGTAFTASPTVNVAVLVGMSVALFVASYVALRRKDSL
ncbi:MAG: ABC transporter permease, partial [Dehalococcoidia bacterium]|nr:ABC transporter permease [Dehalococcoidia bacterium]